jgi:molecular chaperone IbpA
MFNTKTYYNSATGEIKDLGKELAKAGEELVTDFFNIFDHPDFPFATLSSAVNNGRNFPPYNITEEDGKIRLVLAVAGYTKDRLTVELQGNSLVIRGAAEVTTKAPKTVHHRGISNAAFVRAFDMQPNTVVEEVTLKDGLLSVVVSVKKPDKPKTTFEIK